MRLPRDLSGDELIRILAHFGYQQVRQTGSHVRLENKTMENEHHITIPRHQNIRLGTLNSILNDVATHLAIDKSEILKAR